MWHDPFIMMRLFFSCSVFGLTGCKPTIPCQEGFVRASDGNCHQEGPLFDSGDLEDPNATQDLWNWQIAGEAQLSNLGTDQAQWVGSSTWIYTRVETGEVLCRYELETRAFGREPFCEQEPQCSWAFLVEHYEGVSAEGNCETNVGLEEGSQAAVWQLGFAETWGAGDLSRDNALLAWASAGSDAGEGWEPVGSGALEGQAFQYEFDPVQFYVFTE